MKFVQIKVYANKEEKVVLMSVTIKYNNFYDGNQVCLLWFD